MKASERKKPSETNGVLRTSSSCVFLMVVSCLLQISVCLACGDGWARLRQSPDTPLMSHFSSSKPAPSPCTATWWRVTDGLRLSYTQNKLPPTIYDKRRLIQDRTHIVTQIHLLLKPFSCLLSDSHHLCFSFSLCCSVCFSLRDLSWKMLFASAQIIHEVGKGTRGRRERVRRAECKGHFFFQDQPAYKSNPITSPWLCSIVGLNGDRRRQASSREHIVG